MQYFSALSGSVFLALMHYWEALWFLYFKKVALWCLLTQLY